jgi:hypothetical protein
MTEEPHKAFIGAYARGADTDLTIPRAVLERAERELDEARARREAARAEEIAREVEAARKPSLWARLRAMLRRRT